MKLLTYLMLASAITFASCASQRTVVNNYLQNTSDTTTRIDTIPGAVIQKNDLLSILVYSTALGTAPEVDAPYNLPASTLANGIIVDRNGNIEYPQLGTIHAEGLTREDLAELIRKRLSSQLTNPSVIVRFVNFRFTILGQVNRPSTYTVATEHITILEALGLGGDITDYGRKDNVKVLREVNGVREVGTIDLTSTNVFESPYYYLRQNDVVMIDQTTKKIRQQDQQTLISQIGIATSILTAIALILNLIR